MKRTELKRKTPLARGAPMKRTSELKRTRIKSAGKKKMPRLDDDPRYLAWVRLQDCTAAELGHPCRGIVHAHHPKHQSNGDSGGTAGRRCPDARAFALCAEHHVGAGLHNLGGPFRGWVKAQIRAWSDIQSLTSRARYLVWMAGHAVEDLASSIEPEKREVLPS